MASDPESGCLERALAFGATHAFSAEASALSAGVYAATAGRGADVVVDAAGTASSVGSGLALVRTGGTVLLAGTVAPVGKVGFDPEQIVRRMLTIRGVHNYHPSDLAAALAFLAGAGRTLPFATLVAARYPLEQAEAAFAHAHALAGLRVGVT
jgi:threonine dehydrogenase-like Zn-dependent dehydrogenase